MNQRNAHRKKGMGRIMKSEVSGMKRSRTRELTYVAAGVALIAICSWISVPTAVPFTLQTFAVFLTAGLLGGRRTTWSVAVYILLGCMGLPVFAGFSCGPGVIMGLTGGYIAGFLVTALFMWATEKVWRKRELLFFIDACMGLLICYFLGTLWFMKVYAADTGAIGMLSVLSMCVFPYVLPDLVKIGAAAYLVKRLKNVIK